MLPVCTHLPHATAPTPISSVTTIIDLEGVSFGLMWSLRAHLQQASVLATANYPETLCATIVVGAPSFFSTIWGWVKVPSSPSLFPTARAEVLTDMGADMVRRGYEE